MAAVTSGNILSLLNLAMPWWSTLPLPDGTISQGDQQHMLGLYSGILVGTGGTAEVTYAWIGVDECEVYQPGASQYEVFQPGATEYEVRQ